MPTNDPPVEVFYDGSCPLCSAEIGLYRRRDGTGALGFTDISAPGADLPEGLSRPRAMARFHVRVADGRVLSGAAAFAELWRHVPSWRWLARLAALPGMLWAMERGYRLFLRLRPALVRAFTALKGGRA
jgi:predicted DCC family thiol-disulfide oxidoreductase YuxK